MIKVFIGIFTINYFTFFTVPVCLGHGALRHLCLPTFQRLHKEIKKIELILKFGCENRL